jgi:hypothetical protein
MDAWAWAFAMEGGQGILDQPLPHGLDAGGKNHLLLG